MAAKLRPRKQPLQARAVATVEAILGAAARVLVKEGFAAASTNRIAEVAGVSIGSLYQYFPSKEALVTALLERHFHETTALVQARMQELISAPLEDAARALIGLMVEVHRHDPKLHRVLMEEAARTRGLARLGEIEAEVNGMVRAYLELRKDELAVKDRDLAAFVVTQTVEALTHAAVLFRPDLLEHADFVDEITTLVVCYLRGRPRARGRKRPRRPSA